MQFGIEPGPERAGTDTGSGPIRVSHKSLMDLTLINFAFFFFQFSTSVPFLDPFLRYSSCALVPFVSVPFLRLGIHYVYIIYE